MASTKKKTKDCIDPWSFLFIKSNGSIQPCCKANDSELNKIGLHSHDPEEIINGQRFIDYRKGLLSGDLMPICTICAQKDWTDTERLKKRVQKYLVKDESNRDGRGSIEMLSSNSTEMVQVELTSRCNLSCSYCLVSTPTYKGMDLNPKHYDTVLKTLKKRNVEIVYPNGHGETTIVKEWTDFCNKLIDSGMRLFLITNLNKMLSDIEAKTLSRFDTVRISIDTINPKLIKKIRRGGDVRNILWNMENIRFLANRANRPAPHFHWNCVLSDKNIDHVEEFVDFGLFLGVRKFHFCNFRSIPGSHGEGTLHHFLDCPIDVQQQRIELLEKVRDKIAARKGYFAFSGGMPRPQQGFHSFKPNNGNIIYRTIYDQNPNGSDRIHLIKFDCQNKLKKGLFVHSGEKVTVPLQDKALLSLSFQCMLIDRAVEEADDQVFVIFDGKGKKIFKYISKKGSRHTEHQESFKITITDECTFALEPVHSNDMGWGVFAIDTCTVLNPPQ